MNNAMLSQWSLISKIEETLGDCKTESFDIYVDGICMYCISFDNLIASFVWGSKEYFPLVPVASIVVNQFGAVFSAVQLPTGYSDSISDHELLNRHGCLVLRQENTGFAFVRLTVDENTTRDNLFKQIVASKYRIANIFGRDISAGKMYLSW